LTLHKDAEDGPSIELVLERARAEAQLTVSVNGQPSVHTIQNRELTSLNEALRQVTMTVLPQSRSVGAEGWLKRQHEYHLIAERFPPNAPKLLLRCKWRFEVHLP
jgi:hypothetical protein